MNENRVWSAEKGTMKVFFSMLAKAKLPYIWIGIYIIVSMVLANVSIQVTEYTAQMFAGNVSFIGCILPFLIYTLFSLVISGISGVLSGLCTARIDRNLRRCLWEKIVNLPLGFYGENQPKELISRITTDVTSVSQLVMQVFVGLITTVYATVVVFKQINSYNSRLMVALIVLLPLQVLIAVLAGRLKFGLGKEVNQKQANLTKSIAERTGQSLLIKSFGTEDKEYKNVGNKMKSLYKISIQNAWVVNMISPIYSVVGAMQFILLVMVGRHFYASGDISLPQWIAFFAFANQLLNNITAYTGYWTQMRSVQGCTWRLSNIINETSENTEQGEEVIELKGDIYFNDISFGFSDKLIFDDLNLTIPQGKITAIIGKSGSGKTTLLNMIHRLFDPVKGSVCIGEDDLSKFNKKSLRSSITYVTQESLLFSGTIRQNLVVGLNREVSDDELDNACKKAGAYDFIQSLPILC